ncbi:unnamed protein product [Effrenium voratum]|nr:unnamed protein product [Effrenium voratum]
MADPGRQFPRRRAAVLLTLAFASQAFVNLAPLRRRTCTCCRAGEEWYPPRIRMRDLEVGMELRGRRGKYFQNGVFIDVGAERDGYLHVNEWQEEGFPQEQIFARNVPVDVRVLSIDDAKWSFSLTRLPGSLERPPGFKAPKMEDSDIEAFDKLEADDLIDAEVVRLALFGIFVKVQVEGSQMLEGLLHKSKMSQDFKDMVRLGMPIKVKLLKEQRWKEQRKLFLASPEYGTS